MQTIEDKLLARVRGHGRGWAFSARDFVTLGRVDTALARLCNSGKIWRIIRGGYDYPSCGELLKCQLSPDIHEVARAIARKFAWEIEPDGATALNSLGLSTQVADNAPAMLAFLELIVLNLRKKSKSSLFGRELSKTLQSGRKLWRHQNWQ